MVQMDSMNLEWRFCLYSIYRYERRSARHFGVPSNNEIRVITEAHSLPNAEFDDAICAGYVYTLADIANSQQSTPVQYGSETFYSFHEIERYIRTKVE